VPADEKAESTTAETRSRARATEAQADEKPDKPEKPEYPVERLIEDAQGFLGCEPHVAAGAPYDGPKSMTVADAKAAVKSWLKREINPPEEE